MSIAYPSNARSADQRFGIGLARAFGGAIIFSLPMLMTMEMWQLGFAMSRFRLALLLLVTIPLLIGLSHYIGFEETFEWKDDALDAFVAMAVGFVAAAVVLSLFSIIEFGMSAGEVIGKVSIQAAPGSIGAMFAQSEFHSDRQDKQRHARYGGKLFIMAAGALFLGLNVAPTDEMIVIAYKTSAWHCVALALISLIVMHGFVYTVEFRGHVHIPPHTPVWSVFLRFTIVGYAIVLMISFYLLWTFGRTEGVALRHIISSLIVLGFPGAIGAAAARLLL